MMKTNNLKEIRELIEYGFNPELIAFELNISVEDVLEYKKELNCKENSISDDYQRVKLMRRRYNRLYYNEPIEEKSEPQVNDLTIKKYTIIEKLIKYLQKKTEELKGLREIMPRRAIAEDMLSKLKIIKVYPLSMEQSEKIYNSMNVEELKGLRLYSNDKVDSGIENVKKDCISSLAKDICFRVDEITDLKELRELEKRLTPEIRNKYRMIISYAETKISQKRLKIQQKNAIDRLNDVSPNIKEILKDLACGNLDINRANEIINEEVNKKIEKNPKGEFAFTEEQQRKMILMQIRKALTDKPEEYQIQNPQKAMTQLYELDNENLEIAVHTVVENLKGRKDFNKAIELCNQFLTKGNNMRIMEYARNLKRKIRISKISNFALDGIKMKLPFEEEDSFLQLLEYGIKKENIKLEEITLGRSKDGRKLITLADVWPDEIITQNIISRN